MAAIKYLSCESDSTLAHICSPCGETEHGRIRALVLFDTDFDTSDANLTADKIKTGIESSKVHIIVGRGTYDGGSAQTGTGYGDEAERVTDYAHSITFNDPTYASNRDFYQTARNRKWHIAYITETLAHIVDDKPVSMQAIAPVEEDLTSEINWQSTLSWNSLKLPRIALRSVFEAFLKCFDLSGTSSSSES